MTCCTFVISTYVLAQCTWCILLYHSFKGQEYGITREALLQPDNWFGGIRDAGCVIKKAKRVHPTENKRKFHLISLHYIKLDNPHSRLHLSSQHFLLPRLPGGDVHPPVWYPYLQSQHKRARRQLNIVLLKKAIFQASVEKRLKATVPKVV